MQYIFVIFLSYVCWQWMSLYLFATGIKKGKEAIEIVKDKRITHSAIDIIYL